MAAAKLEMDTQAQRAREFQQQVNRAYKRADRQAKLDQGYTELTRADLARMLKRWKRNASHAVIWRLKTLDPRALVYARVS